MIMVELQKEVFQSLPQ
jgi:hypothetical protein